MTDIVRRLRQTRADMLGTSDEQHFHDCHEAAAEIERLRAALKVANDQTEHFEREWYLRGDDVERLRADAERWRAALALPMTVAAFLTDWDFDGECDKDAINQAVDLEADALRATAAPGEGL